jgi:phage portal protein BeeE
LKIRDIAKQVVQSFTTTNKNAIGTSLGNQFLRYGNRDRMLQDWSQVIVNDRDMYTGYVYAAINRIAHRGAYLAQENVKTMANPKTEEAAKNNDEGVTHPYITLIDESRTFTNYQFWSTALRYLNLKGAYYIMAVRAVNGERVGNIQEFKLLNPYNIERVFNADHTKLAGYREYRNGMQRDILPEMVIPIFIENPFDNDEPYSTLDAAKETQFTMKQAGDYTRKSLKNNMSAPGIVSTDVELETNQFENFRARILAQEKGEPIFGNGSGAVKWEPMQTDLDKASLATINEINRDVLLAVTGVSKTTLNIEQSGVTRDTAKVQSDLFITDTIMPQMQEVLDALNQDYKNYYEADYEKYGYKLYIDSPLGNDIDAENKDNDLKTKNFDLYMKLVAQGYESEVAGKYVEGKINLEEIGTPSNPPVVIPTVTEPVEEVDETENKHDHSTDFLEVVQNNLGDEGSGIVNNNQGVLQNTITNLDARIVAGVINKITKTKNAFENESDLVTERQKREYEQELEFALGTFYAVIIPLYATAVLSRRLNETSMFATFNLDNKTKAYIKKTAKLASESHINTVLDDLLRTTREQAIKGATEQELISAIRMKYNEVISETRARTIARTETNRAFTQAQFEADRQFIDQNDLQGRVFKQWVTRSGNPCEFCLAMEARPPIPFNSAFADLGDTLETVTDVNGKTKVSKLTVGFEAIEAGNLHPNCACIYQLIIE